MHVYLCMCGWCSGLPGCLAARKFWVRFPCCRPQFKHMHIRLINDSKLLVGVDVRLFISICRLWQTDNQSELRLLSLRQLGLAPTSCNPGMDVYTLQWEQNDGAKRWLFFPSLPSVNPVLVLTLTLVPASRLWSAFHTVVSEGLGGVF